jgi:hypothetical protein
MMESMIRVFRLRGGMDEICSPALGQGIFTTRAAQNGLQVLRRRSLSTCTEPELIPM